MSGARGVIALIFLLSAASCSANEGAMSGDEGTNIVAGHNEPSFNDSFGLSVKLPMAETGFVSLLNSQEISFRIISPENGGIPAPRHRQNIDVSQFVRMYEIYGDVDVERHVGKRFRAYANSRGDIIYIENAFSYPNR